MAGVGVATDGDTGAPAGVAALGAQLPHCAVQRGDVATVAVDEDQTPGPGSGRPAVLHQQHCQGFDADRDRSGETLMLTTRTVGDGRCDQPVLLGTGLQACSRPGCDGGRDARIGVQRQVRTVLLSRPKRDKLIIALQGL